MKKLEDLPKRVDYKVPDGYFDNLPGRVQSRIGAGKENSWRFNLGFSLRLAFPLVALLAVGIFWYNQSGGSVEGQLGEIDESQLAWFIDDTEMTSEELAEDVSWSAEDLDALEEEVYKAIDESGEGLDIVIDDLDLENF